MHNHTRLIGRMTISGLAASGMLHAQDFPDPYFVDSNGDGIDGELNQAIFVAPPPLGNNANSGMTPESPVATISQGISLAQTHLMPQVLVQVGTYNESLTMVGGVHVFGGFDATWARVQSTGSVATIVQGGNTAVLANAVNVPATLSFLTLRSTNAVAAGESSYGIRVINSAGPVFIRYNRIEPGSGADGTDAADAPDRSPTQAPNGLDGQAARQSSSTIALLGGAGGNNPTCPDASNIGGQGGSGGVGITGANGQSGEPGSGGATAGGGGATSSSFSTDGAPGAGGGNGAAGSLVASGSVAVSVVGALNSGLYVPPQGSAGVDGTHGKSGAGGGGGGGQNCSVGCNPDLGGSGGGGGAGGCAGFGAQSGGAGGASIGIVVDNTSNATIADNYLKPSSGGQGGDGGDGGDAQSGGPRGLGGPVGDDGGAGGAGGQGGNGGAGGPGAGGHGGASIGIFDPTTRAVVDRLRYTQAATAALPGAHGASNPNALPSSGVRVLRHPTPLAAQPAPTPTIASFTLVEPATGSVTAYIPVTLSGTTEAVTTVGYSVTNGTATGGGTDFTLANGNVVFNPWTNQASIAVQVHADPFAEGSETFTVTPTGPGIFTPATITIVDDALFADGFD
ncbi:MAG: hypothetical protein IPO95_03665 [Rhodanobacteraceae bacterium]|nr:hypothetical protein [Rhodanobacteraceae bacterium]MBP6077939.1 hypothetical protein [Xanthomonadales bacterium]